jgi:hypothetical protein
MVYFRALCGRDDTSPVSRLSADFRPLLYSAGRTVDRRKVRRKLHLTLCSDSQTGPLIIFSNAD